VSVIRILLICLQQQLLPPSINSSSACSNPSQQSNSPPLPTPLDFNHTDAVPTSITTTTPPTDGVYQPPALPLLTAITKLQTHLVNCNLFLMPQMMILLPEEYQLTLKMKSNNSTYPNLSIRTS
jgi:hypothetical protein